MPVGIVSICWHRMLVYRTRVISDEYSYTARTICTYLGFALLALAEKKISVRPLLACIAVLLI